MNTQGRRRLVDNSRGPFFFSRIGYVKPTKEEKLQRRIYDLEDALARERLKLQRFQVNLYDPLSKQHSALWHEHLILEGQYELLLYNFQKLLKNASIPLNTLHTD